jgi:hypothetical protein
LGPIRHIDLFLRPVYNIYAILNLDSAQIFGRSAENSIC